MARSGLGFFMLWILYPALYLSIFFGFGCVYVLWKHWNDTYFIKRHHVLSLLLLILGGIVPNIACLISTHCFLFFPSTRDLEDLRSWSHNNSDMRPIFIFCDSLWYFAWLCFICLVSARSYLLFFDAQYSSALLDSDWQNKLDPSFDLNIANFYVRNKHRFGSVRFLLTRAFVPFVILFSALFGVLHTQGLFWVSNLLFFFVVVVAGGLQLFVLRSARFLSVYNDRLNIRAELALITRVFAGTIVLFGLWFVAAFAAFDSRGESVWPIFWVSFYISAASSVSLSYVLSFFVVRVCDPSAQQAKRMNSKNGSEKDLNGVRVEVANVTNASDGNVPVLTSTSNSVKSGNNSIVTSESESTAQQDDVNHGSHGTGGKKEKESFVNKISEAIPNTPKNKAKKQRNLELTEKKLERWEMFVNPGMYKKGYVVFIRYLSSVHCAENLLFLSEYYSFKQLIHVPKCVIGAARNDKESGIFDDNLVLPADLPESVKVKEFRQGECSVIEVYWYLFKKYIESRQSLFEINISSRVRKSITAMMNKKYRLSAEQTKKLNDEDGKYIIPATLSFQIGGNKEWQMDEEDVKAEIIKDLMPLFDECRKQLGSLLQQSYRMFQLTDEYETVIRELASHGGPG